MARRLDDRAGLAIVLVRAFWSRGTSSLEEILEMLTEAMAIGEELGDTEIRAEAMSWRVPTFVALGDLDSARGELEALQQTAEQTAQPFMLHVAAHYGSAIALCDGRLDHAELMAQRSHEWSNLLAGRDALGIYGIQMFGIRREQGRLAELAPVIRVLGSQDRGTGPWRPGLVSVLVELGMDTEARRELARVAADGLDGFRESLWVASLTYLTDASAALGDEATAALVYPELAPLAGTAVMIGHMVSCYGAADRYLGMLAATLGEWDRADEHFERATELNRRHGHGHVARPHPLPARPGAAGARRRRRGAGCSSARRRRSPSAAICRRCSAGSGSSGPPADRRGARRAVVPRGPDPRAGGARPQQPRDRRHAVDQRAHGREPHPQHPAQDGLRQPHPGRLLRPSPRPSRV